MSQKYFGFPTTDEIYNELVEATAAKHGYTERVFATEEVAEGAPRRIPNPQTKEEFAIEQWKKYAAKLLKEGGASIVQGKAIQAHNDRIDNLKL